MPFRRFGCRFFHFTDGRVPRHVHEAKQNRVHGRAIADAMMETQDHGRAARDVLHQMDVPQWLGEIERRARQIADEALELHHVARCRQGHAMDVRIQIEVGIDLPVGRAHR